MQTLFLIRRLRYEGILALALLAGVAGVTHAEDVAESASTAEPAAQEARIEELEETVGVLAEEMGRLESIFAVPEELALESFSGLGPAASKVYKRESGLSIGGYGEVRLRSFLNQGDDNQDDVFDAVPSGGVV